MSPFEIFRTPIEIYRFDGGSYVNGIWQENSRITIPATASVQPLKGEEIQLLPEGRRDSEQYKMYTSTRIIGVKDDKNPDRVRVLKDPFSDIIFEVIQINTWQNNSNFNIVNHYKYICLRLHPLP